MTRRKDWLTWLSESGRLDAAVQDSIAGDEGFLKTPAGANFAFLGGSHVDPEIHGIGAGIGVRKEDTELRDNLSAAILALRENGKYETINAKYFDFDVY